jgi:hypothetical protein
MKNAVFWDVALCRSCVNRRFGGTSVHIRSIRRHIPEDGIPQSNNKFVRAIRDISIMCVSPGQRISENILQEIELINLNDKKYLY